jgi:hypothetical protein
MFATNFEIGRINDAGAGSPGNHFLSLSFADLKIVIDERSWVDRHGFPPFTNILDREILEFDFLTRHVFYTRPVRRLLFRCSLSAADWTNESQQTPEHEDKSRIISHVSVASLFERERGRVRVYSRKWHLLAQTPHLILSPCLGGEETEHQSEK